MNTVKISISLNVNVLEAVDAVVKSNLEKSRSAFIERVLRENNDVWSVLEEIKPK